MKTKNFITSIIVMLTLSLHAQNIVAPAAGPHGGTVKNAGGYNIEMHYSYPDIFAYLLTKDLKSISNKGILCNVKFILPDNTSVETDLKPFGDDGFTTNSCPLLFNATKINFNLSGKYISTKFENDNPIVEKAPTRR